MAGNIKIVVDVGLARDPVTVMTPIVDAAKKTHKAVTTEGKATTEDEKKELAKRIAAQRRFAQDQAVILAGSLAASKKHFRDRRAAQDAAAKDDFGAVQRGFANAKKAQAQHTRETIAEVKKELKGIYQARAQAADDARRMQEKADRAASQSRRAAARESAKQKRELAAIERDVQGRIDRDAAASQRDASRAQKARDRQAAKDQADSRRNVRRGIIAAGAMVGAGVGLAYKGAKWAAGAIGVNSDMASHVQSAMDLEHNSVALSNQAYMAGEPGEAGMRQDPRRLRQEVRDTADYAAMDPGDVMGGLQKFVAKTGDLRMGRDLMKDMAQLSKATDANFSDMIDAAADAANQLKGTEGAAESVKEVMRGVAGQGKLGAVEIKDMAVQMAKVAAAASQYGGDRKRNILLMGAFAQEARERGGAASAPQAATAVQSFTAQFSKGKRLDALHAMGVKTHDAAGNILDAQSIMTSLLQVTKGDPRKMQSGIMDQQAQRVTRGFAEIYRNTYATTHGSAKEKEAAATAAYTAELQRLMDATIKQEEIEASFARAMETSQSKVQLFNNQLAKVGEELMNAIMPAFEQLAPHLVGLAKTFAGIIGIAGKLLGLKDPKEATTVAAGETAYQGAKAATAGLKGDIETGTYNPEHVKVSQDRLKEVNTALIKEQEVLDHKEHPHQWLDDNGQPAKSRTQRTREGPEETPLMFGYDSWRDAEKGAEYDALQRHVNDLKGQVSELSGQLSWTETLKQGGVLKVFVTNQEKKPAKPTPTADSPTTGSAVEPP